MKKKRRNPEPERSAFESARAALERAGEDPSAPPEPSADDTKAFVTLRKPESPSVTEASAPEAADSAATATADNAQASEPEAADNAEASAPETVGDAQASEAEAANDAPEAADNAEQSEAEPPAPEAVSDAQASESKAVDSPEAADNADTAESVEAFAPADNAEMSASAPEAAENAEMPAPEIAEASAPVESASAPETASENISAPTGDAAERAEPSETPAPEAVGGATNPEPSDAETLTAEPEASDFEASKPFSDEDEDDGSWQDAEIAETERHTMETKEITVGYHRQRTEGGTEAAKGRKGRGTKSPFNALNQLKDAIQGNADAEREDYGNDAPPSGSPRDAALRKRVMQIEDDETRNYLLDRVLPQMTWYSKRSAQYRSMYYRLMAATIFLGALIPVFSVGGSYGVVKVIIALLGASVTAINAYIALHNYHDLWITYQKTREDLIHTLYCYFNNAGVFSQKEMPQKDLNVLLVDICEDTLSKENGGWTTIVQKT